MNPLKSGGYYAKVTRRSEGTAGTIHICVKRPLEIRSRRLTPRGPGERSGHSARAGFDPAKSSH